MTDIPEIFVYSRVIEQGGTECLALEQAHKESMNHERALAGDEGEVS